MKRLPTKQDDAALDLGMIEPGAAQQGAGPDGLDDVFAESDSISRRRFLAIMSASLALAGTGGCSTRPPLGKIVPHSRNFDSQLQGQAQFFATSMTSQGVALGLLVKSYEGRPVKIEGNPEHPASLGATDTFAQASLLDLYDQDRSKATLNNGQPSSMSSAVAALRSALERQAPRGGSGLAILTETITSPSLASYLIGHGRDSMRSRFPEAKWYQYDAVRSDATYEATQQAFGRRLDPVYDLREADVILSLDADFLHCGPKGVRLSKDFSARRRTRQGDDPARMNRLYAIESTPTLTGAAADHRLAMKACDVEPFARALAGELGMAAAGAGDRRWLSALARDLRIHRGRSVVIPGDGQPAAVHALAFAINHELGNIGHTVRFIEPIDANPTNQTAGLRELVDAMAAGRIDIILILGANPVYTAPADFEFGAQLCRVPFRVHHGLYYDETAAQCQWHIPEAHYLESWGDARAADGTISLIQPLIAPMYGGRTAVEFLASAFAGAERRGDDIVRDFWREYWPRPSRDFARDWRQALHNGFIAETASLAQSVSLRGDWLTPASPAIGGFEVIFRPDPTVFDGRYANNGWLQELPKPLTKLTWDNAALISPATAESLGIQSRIGRHGGEHGETIVDCVNVRVGNRSLESPVWIIPGHPDHSVTLTLGYGRTRAGRVGNGLGVDAYRLRTAQAASFVGGVEITKVEKTAVLACTQGHHAMEGRDLVRRLRTQERSRSDVETSPADRRLVPLTLLPPPDLTPSENQWGMAIDLSVCTGCSACVIACQAENNTPVVGKTEVTRGREMHWLRIDRYYVEAAGELETYFQPIPCMHCENAPCEVVCPVAATTHSADGLNDMVYNRCVGTRYCSNNCPYKVRRFNFLAYSDFTTEAARLGRNPDVTVRSRGVMEKCTYCVQRIRGAEIEARTQNRLLRDGEVVTACEAACPAQAIVFGNINDRTSRVARAKSEPRNYGLLEELNTRPRTTYLAVVRNPNPELER